MADSLYVPLGAGRFASTELTQGPWHPAQQHGSPPAALLAYAMERAEPRPEMEFTQFAVDLLRPVPVGEVEVQARVARPGRRVQFLTAELIADGEPVARARGWRIRRADTSDIAAPESPPPHALPDKADERPFIDFGYFHALEWRYVSGAVTTPGPAVMWTRLKVPVVPGEKPSPLQRVAGVADTSSGISAALSFDTHIFTNVDFTLHLLRALSGEWVCLDAATTIGPEGTGLCRTRLYDERGDFGSVAQTLFVAPR
ncbi:MAG TPA: thioesterase family protein [Streptosporangiaceae bacterium]|nr:thioesterase family protein [Streptosporangiaceae bacterium]